MKRNSLITLERIEGCMVKCAELVDQYGDELMPLLTRLEGMRSDHIAKRDAGKHVDRIKAMLETDKAPPLA